MLELSEIFLEHLVPEKDSSPGLLPRLHPRPRHPAEFFWWGDICCFLSTQFYLLLKSIALDVKGHIEKVSIVWDLV